MKQVVLEGVEFGHDWKPACAADYVGCWMIEPVRANALIESVQRNGLPQVDMAEVRRAPKGNVAYMLDGDGVAHINISGVMMKPVSKTGGTSTVMTRRALRMAVNDRDVRGILIHADSPGGTADGTAQLADEVASVNAEMPVHVYIDDVGASALLYATAYSERITALPTGWVGSIGTRMAVVDQSAMTESLGLKVVPLVSEFDGVRATNKVRFEPGTEVTEDDIAYAQKIVQASGEQFYAALQKGRRLSKAAMRAVADGAIYPAAEAVSKGLVDATGTIDDARKGLLAAIRQREAAARQSERRSRVKALGAVPKPPRS